MSRKYFPNDWEMWKELPEELLTGLDPEEFLDNVVFSWKIPSSVKCILRVHNVTKNKVTEYTYQREHAAQARYAKEMQVDDDVEVTLCTHSGQTVITNFLPPDYHEDDYEEI